MAHVTVTIKPRLVSYRTGVVSARAYPMFAPYRIAGGNEGGRKMSGRLPRLLSIMFATLIDNHDPCVDVENRRLTLNGGFKIIARKFGIYSGTSSRQQVLVAITSFMHAKFPTDDETGYVTAAEDCGLSMDAIDDGWIQFTPEYFAMLQEDLKEVPLSYIGTFTHSPFILDVFMVATLYGDPSKRTIVTYQNLKKLLPGSMSARVNRTNCVRAANDLNKNQDYWTFSATKAHLSISPRDMAIPPNSPVAVLDVTS